MSSVGLSKFVTEGEVEEAKKRRQEEWQKNKKPEDPEVAPESEPQDFRPLYDRLEEQRLRKESEKEESKKLKNLVKGLDSEEVEFLEQVDEIRMKHEHKEREEERRELEEFKLRSQFARTAPEPNFNIEPSKPKGQSSKVNNQAKLLAGAIKRKHEPSEESPTEKKPSMCVGAAKVYGILPGLGNYFSDSSDNDSDASADIPPSCLNILSHETHMS